MVCNDCEGSRGRHDRNVAKDVMCQAEPIRDSACSMGGIALGSGLGKTVDITGSVKENIESGHSIVSAMQGNDVGTQGGVDNGVSGLLWGLDPGVDGVLEEV